MNNSIRLAVLGAIGIVFLGLGIWLWFSGERAAGLSLLVMPPALAVQFAFGKRCRKRRTGRHCVG